MFDGASDVQLAGRLLKVHYLKLTVMCGVEYTLSLFFNDVSKIPIVHQIISAHKMIYNMFGSVIYHNLHSILIKKYQEPNNKNIGILGGMILGWLDISWRFTKTCGCKKFSNIISSAESVSIPTNDKFEKAARYIHDNKSWERYYILLKIMFPCMRVL